MHIFPFYVSFPNDYKAFHNTEIKSKAYNLIMDITVHTIYNKHNL